MEGFYDNPNLHREGVTARLCRHMIINCHKRCNDFISQGSQLDGTIDVLEASEHELIGIPDDIEHGMDPFTRKMEDDEGSDEEP
jgi:hypothetical protein